MLRIIGDVHGLMDEYLDLIKGVDHSVQLGDMGLNYRGLSTDPNHKWIAGNHDNYNWLQYHDNPGYLEDFGIWPSPIGDIFYVRGAWSIDKQYRKANGLKWYYQEEMDYQMMSKCVELYTKTKPRLVISHDCPTSLIHPMLKRNAIKTRTGMALQIMFENHQPERWWFGHHHKSWTQRVNGTRFRCLAELEFEDVT